MINRILRAKICLMACLSAVIVNFPARVQPIWVYVRLNFLNMMLGTVATIISCAFINSICTGFSSPIVFVCIILRIKISFISTDVKQICFASIYSA